MKGSSTTKAANTSTYTPPSSTSPTPTVTTVPAQLAVQQTCQTGKLWNYSATNIQSNGTSSKSAGTTTLHNATGGNTANTADILDYPAIPGGYNVLTGLKIANESCEYPHRHERQYDDDDLLQPEDHDGGIAESVVRDGHDRQWPGSYQPVITNLSITNPANGFSNGALPSYVRFGFAGSSGGSTNIHEIMCFKSVPAVQSASSAGVNQKQSAEIQPNEFAYFAFYDPNKWVGRVTANSLSVSTDANTGAESVTIAATPTWDASCVLTGATASQCSTGKATTAQAPSSRVIVTYNGTTGVPFEWGSLTTTTPGQQVSLAVGDASGAPSTNRVSYLRGDRTQEINSNATCTQLQSSSQMPCFRVRDGVLGDIIDSSRPG